MDWIFELPTHLFKNLGEQHFGDEVLIPGPDHLISNFVLKKLDRVGISHMGMRLKIGRDNVGVITFLAQKGDRFTKEHARKIRLLREIFTIGVSNTLTHLELIQLKEQLADDNRYLNRELVHLSGDSIIGANGGLKPVMELVNQVAPLNNTVLLLGKTGVGKEVIANAIHEHSPRKEGPLIKVNCGAISENLIDSELFGHEKGAFTGATGRKRGRFERADHGTLFLDEIGELPPSAQVRLLRVLQHREIERVGGTKTIPIDVRIIAATNRNLEEMIKLGEFREDLWYRINVFPVHIPPLRHRKEDIQS